MPFTFSHPAAVVPIFRALPRYTVLSALVVGSMAPDFQNFLPLDVERRDSHSLPGILWFSLPVGMALYLLFHLLLKRPLASLLPTRFCRRLPGLQAKTPLLPQASGLAVVVSLLIGIATHLLWDAFTHYSYVTVFAFPILSEHLFSVGGYHVYLYKLLQHASTVAGAVLLWVWARAWLRSAPVGDNAVCALLSATERAVTLAILLLVPPAIGAGLAYHSYATAYGIMPLKDVVRETVVFGISAFHILLLVYCLAWHALVLPRSRH